MKNRFYRYLSFLLVVCLVFLWACFCTPMAKAEETADFSVLKSYLNQEMKNFTAEIDLSAYHIRATQTNTAALTRYIFDELPECFHVVRGEFSYDEENRITVFRPTYHYTKAVYEQMLTACKTAAERLLSGIEGNAALSDVQKALLIHDRLIVACEYDTGVGSCDVTDPVFTMYSALVTGKSVCYGYSKAYMYLLSRVGIQSRLCTSATLNHTWNIVTVNGKDYYVDVTYDDPIYDKTGQVLHTNFLRSSAGIYETGHKASDYDKSPADTTYDKAFWQESQSEFCLFDNEIYYFDNNDGTLCRYGDKKVMFTEKYIWYYGMVYFSGNYTRIAACEKGILYNTDKKVKLYCPAENTYYTVFTPDYAYPDKQNIYGFTLNNGWLLCDVCDSPNYTSVTKQNGLQKKKLDLSNLTKEEDTASSDTALKNYLKISGNVILPAKTFTVQQLTKAIETVGVTKADGTAAKSDGFLGTGDVIRLKNGVECRVIVKGDSDGDGEITAADARMTLRGSVGLETLSELQTKAVLVSGGDEVSAADARLILRCAVGLEKL